ncbi:MAG: hypothetical protein RLZZ501_2451 [Pseudomonadota bacterium]
MKPVRLSVLLLPFLLLTAVPLAADPVRSAADPAAFVRVTAASTDPAFRALRDHERAGLMAALRRSVGEGALTDERLNAARQTAPLADQAWLDAAGYDFKAVVAEAQEADIALLAPFRALPRETLDANLHRVEAINAAAGPAERDQALYDAYGINHLFFLAEALGPRLGEAFLRAYEKGGIAKAAALIKASEVSTAPAKRAFDYRRPFEVAGNRIQLVPDRIFVATGAPYKAAGGAFPSGHTNAGITDSLLLAAMLPERYAALVARGAGYGYSRLVLGVHYPLDLIGARMIVERNLARFLADPAYHALFVAARDQLRAALETECGVTLVVCARPAGPEADPWAAPAAAAFHAYALTYGLARIDPTDRKLSAPIAAAVLLAPLRPDLSAADLAEVLRATALPAGFPLDAVEAGTWQRLDLHRAATLLTH